MWNHFAMFVVLRPALMNGEISSYQPSKQTSIIPRKSFQATAFWVWKTFKGNNKKGISYSFKLLIVQI